MLCILKQKTSQHEARNEVCVGVVQSMVADITRGSIFYFIHVDMGALG